MEKNDILQLIAEWQNRILRIEGIPREYENDLLKSIGSKPIKIITGFRRSGKSFLVLRVAQQLIKKGAIPVSNILYLNFEDFRLAEINTPDKLFFFYQIFRTEIATEIKKILIFDEIQNVQNWERFIRTIYEADTDIEIILTGSNSELLSSEISTRLAGRFIELSIFPFDFTEYLVCKDIKPANTHDYLRNRELIQSHFNRYIKFGGLPEILTIENENTRFSYVEGIISKVILDDVINRFNIKHTVAVEKILFYLLSAIGNIVSFSRIYNYLERLGIQIKQETIIKYVQYMLKTFAIYEIGRFDWKLGRHFATTRKYYAVDTGLVNLYPGTVANFSKQLENIIFIKLMKDRNPVYFGALPSDKEIDFIIQKSLGNFEKYQVTQTLTDRNKDRELSPFLINGGSYFKTGVNVLLSMDEDENEIDYKSAKIVKRNIIRWLLNL